MDNYRFLSKIDVTDLKNKIEVSKVAEVVEWCINQPHGIEIQELTILPTTQLK